MRQTVVNSLKSQQVGTTVHSHIYREILFLGDFQRSKELAEADKS